MIYNGIDLEQFFKVLKINKSVLPAMENILKEIPGKPGAIVARTKIKPIQISVEVEIKGPSKEGLNAIIRELAGILYTEGTRQLRLPNELDKYYMAKLEGDTALEEILNYGRTVLYFICPDPVAYGKLVRVDLNSNTKIYNNGTYPSKGIIKIEITEETDHLEVTLLNTGEFLYIDDNFNTGDIVVIDLEKEYITKNGHSAMPNLYLESDFFEIPVGESEITISNGNGILEFRERWL
jgi:predicted phage tail component-like protein